jgi:hypothetical protein
LEKQIARGDAGADGASYCDDAWMRPSNRECGNAPHLGAGRGTALTGYHLKRRNSTCRDWDPTGRLRPHPQSKYDMNQNPRRARRGGNQRRRQLHPTVQAAVITGICAIIAAALVFGFGRRTVAGDRPDLCASHHRARPLVSGDRVRGVLPARPPRR